MTSLHENHSIKKVNVKQQKTTIALVGNPNCGKTTLFNSLTGARQKTGNWAGVTVDKKTGHYSFEGKVYDLVDLPGSYSLDVGIGDISLDEKIARDYILSKQAKLIINILDASNIERNLYLTTQLLEMRCPMVIVLNMMDTAKEKGVAIKVEALAKKLNCPCVPVIASHRQHDGITRLKQTINALVEKECALPAEMMYSSTIENYIQKFQSSVQTIAEEKDVPARWLAIKLLEGDSTLESLLSSNSSVLLDQIRRSMESNLSEESDIIFADERYGFINRLAQNTIKRKAKFSRSVSSKIDAIVLNKFLGLPIFLFVMYCMFTFAIKVGAAFQDLFQELFEAVFVKGLGHLLSSMHSPSWFIAAATGAGEGVAVVANFVPLIAALFLFLSVLEDTGYMARAAFVVDRLMKKIGLPGKSFVPLIVGFGCNVPAIMATRTLQRERDRKLSIMMNPFMSCGARLQVFSLLAMVFFSHGGQNVVFGLYLLGIVVAVFTGLVMKKTLLPGKASTFVMELPVYHLPTAGVTLTRTWDKLKGFVIRAGKTIVLIVMIITALGTIGKDGTLGNDDSQNSLLAAISQTITPIFEPMGMQRDNWPATVGIFTGVLAKETVAGTLSAIYGQIAASNADKAKESSSDTYSFWGDISAAFSSVPEDFKFWLSSLINPFKQANIDRVSHGTQQTMYAMFGGIASVLAYMIFVLLYIPCVAAMGAVKREIGKRWMLFSVGWTTYLAYTISTIFYQSATFLTHPYSSTAWIAGLLVGIAIIIAILRHLGNRMDNKSDANSRNLSSSGDKAYAS